MSSTIRVALAQLPQTLGDVKANWATAVRAIGHAADAGADLVAFPELHLQGYLADEAFADTAITVPGPYVDEMQRMSQTHGISIALGTARADSGFPHLVYNSCVLTQPDRPVFVYDKTHLGTYGKYREGCYFARGNHISIVQTAFGPMGIEICSDMSFPEVARTLALQGATFHLVLSAGPEEFKDTWPSLLRVRSSENAFLTAYVNTVGDQRGVSFFGGSRIVDPSGNTLAQAQDGVEELLITDVDLSLVAKRRRERLLFRDRVPDLYA